MIKDSGDARAVVALDDLLLDAKLSVPQPNPGAVSRLELIEAARASERPVVGVTAPAGYGKTTLLAEWAVTEHRRTAWVSLDRFDDDPAALLMLLAAAYARVTPESADVVADMGGVGASALGRGAPRLASVFRASPVPFVLMVDDLHELRSAACHDVLGVVMRGVPRGSQLVAASRSEQPHVPRLRASGQAFELQSSDLALDAAGAEQIFSCAQVSVTPELAAAVTERTEGWPVGLYLASLIAADNKDGAVTIAGDDRYVADYLYRESLSQLPEASRRFLRCTAVLDQLCAPLCDALLGQSGAQEMLRSLEASSLFLVPLDRRREWFRYHGLFREFLLGELRRVEPEAVAKLHLRAADWYEANGSPAMALEHLLNTTERERCAHLVTALLLPTYQAGHMSTIQRWLTTVGDAAIEAYPPLAVLAGWTAGLTGQTNEMHRWATIVDGASFDLVPLDGSASFDSARAMLRAVMCPAGPEQMLADATFAVAQEPPWSPWRDTAVGLLAEAHLLLGDDDRAAELFEEAFAVATTMSNTDSIVLSKSILSLLAMDRGRWAEAAEHLQLVLSTIDTHRIYDYVVSVVAFAAAARLAVHRGDLDEAHHRLTQAMRARPTCTAAMPFHAVRFRLHIARVYFAIGDHATARHLLHEIDDVLRQRPALGTLLEEVSAFARTVSSAAKSGAIGVTPLTTAELRVLPYLQTHLTVREIAERTFVSRNTVNSHLGSIYRKLGASSRSEAVELATTVGLLGG